jgi:hypothetical protein
MNIILAILAAAKSIGMAAGILAMGKSSAAISPPSLLMTGTAVSVTCRIDNAYPAELKKLAGTGTAIIMYLFVETRQSRDNRIVSTVSAENSLLYDAVSGNYLIVRKPVLDTLRFHSLDSAVTASAMFTRIPVATKDKFAGDRSYSFILYGVLGKTSVEALNGGAVDLMYFWNYRRPMARTEPFDGRILRGEKK